MKPERFNRMLTQFRRPFHFTCMECGLSIFYPVLIKHKPTMCSHTAGAGSLWATLRREKRPARLTGASVSLGRSHWPCHLASAGEAPPYHRWRVETARRPPRAAALNVSPPRPAPPPGRPARRFAAGLGSVLGAGVQHMGTRVCPPARGTPVTEKVVRPHSDSVQNAGSGTVRRPVS